MIALAVLAALGQAIQAAEMYAAIAAGVLLAAVAVIVAAVIAARRTPQDWEPGRLHRARHRPSRSELTALLEAVDRGDHEGHYDDGSGG